MASTAFKSAVQQVYNRVLRPRLPKRLGVKNGVAVRGDRLLDTSWVDQTVEQPCVDAHATHTQPGDRVTILGGGWGVTPVHAARAGASVTVYEAARQHVEMVRDTAALNGVADAVSVEHAQVGPGVDVWGDTTGERVDPGGLDDCDVLEIDVEGAELAVLNGLEIRPRVLVVEYHPPRGVSEEDIRQVLTELGYRVTNRGVEEPDEAIVLTAVRGKTA